MDHLSQKAIDIFEEVKKLSFPTDHFIIVGSGILAAKGIRDAHDVDMVVSQELFDTCKAQGWELRPWTRSGRPGKEWLKGETVDLMVECHSGEYSFDLKDLKKEGEMIHGIWFLSLKQLIRFKKDYGRLKDFDDIALIEKYLETNRKGVLKL